MAVLFNVPTTTYGAGTHLSKVQNVPAAAKRIRMTITRDPLGWPQGIPWTPPGAERPIQNTAGTISIIMPDGSPGPGQSFAGGRLFSDARVRRFAPIPVPAGFRLDVALYESSGQAQLIEDPFSIIPITTPVLEEYFEFSWFNPETGIEDLPSGAYTFQGDCFVTLRTAIKAERF